MGGGEKPCMLSSVLSTFIDLFYKLGGTRGINRPPYAHVLHLLQRFILIVLVLPSLGTE